MIIACSDHILFVQYAKITNINLKRMKICETIGEMHLLGIQGTTRKPQRVEIVITAHAHRDIPRQKRTAKYDPDR